MKEKCETSYLEKRKKAFTYAGRGLGRLIRNEAHARIHLVAAVAVIIAGVIWKISTVEWCLVSICIGGVLMGEAFNSALEKLADKVDPKYDPLIGMAKDMAAGGVLIMAIAAATVGLIIFIPKIF